MILVVFACTGTSIALLKPYISGLFGYPDKAIFDILYYLFIFPIYNMVLLIYGTIFGLFDFFWEFEKRIFTKLKKLFIRIFTGGKNK